MREDSSSLSDAELYSRLSSETELSSEHLAECYRRFLPLLLASAALVLGGHSYLAEDVAQDVFQRLFLRERQKLDRAILLRPFLRAAARNAAVDVLRLIRSRQEIVATAASEAEPHKPAAGFFREEVHGLLRKLRSEDRLVLELRYLEQCNLEQIAARLGTSYAAAAQRLSRALKAAKEAAKSG